MGTRHILIVDDELQIAASLCRALQYHLDGKYEVKMSLQASKALAELQHRRFELIVTDLRMPEMSGLELIQRARQICPQTRTMLITAFGSPDIERQARELAAAYLPKPFRLQEFIAAVQRILDVDEQGDGAQRLHS